MGQRVYSRFYLPHLHSLRHVCAASERSYRTSSLKSTCAYRQKQAVLYKITKLVVFCTKSLNRLCSFTSTWLVIALFLFKIILLFFLNSCNFLLYLLSIDQKCFWYLKFMVDFCKIASTCAYNRSCACIQIVPHMLLSAEVQ